MTLPSSGTRMRPVASKSMGLRRSGSSGKVSWLNWLGRRTTENNSRQEQNHILLCEMAMTLNTVHDWPSQDRKSALSALFATMLPMLARHLYLYVTVLIHIRNASPSASNAQYFSLITQKYSYSLISSSTMEMVTLHHR